MPSDLHMFYASRQPSSSYLLFPITHTLVLVVWHVPVFFPLFLHSTLHVRAPSIYSIQHNLHIHTYVRSHLFFFLFLCIHNLNLVHVTFYILNSTQIFYYTTLIKSFWSIVQRFESKVKKEKERPNISHCNLKHLQVLQIVPY